MVESGAVLDLYQSIEWGQWLWYKPARWAIGDPSRFKGKTLLEIGPGYGSMSCYFASLGAIVTAVDVSAELLAVTRNRSSALGLPVACIQYGGNYADISGQFDFVFTKSALVMTGKSAVKNAGAIHSLLVLGGEYIGIENLRGPLPTRIVRRWRHPEETFRERFHPFTDEIKAALESTFHHIEYMPRFQSVVAVRAFNTQSNGLG